MPTCPHCDGYQKNYIINPLSSPPTLKERDCILCGGTGEVPLVPVMGSTDTSRPVPPELWPLLIPLGIFVLFFFFLWL